MPDQSRLRPAVFLDRDGTIAEEVGYLNHASRFRMFPFAATAIRPTAIRRLNEAGLSVIVVTNQSGVGRGYFPESLVQTVNELMTHQLAEAGAKIDAIYYCPHTSAENCHCRKPNTGMLDRAAQEHAVDLERSFVVGDRYGDVVVRTGYGEGELAWHAARWPIQPDFVAEDLSQAADLILRERK